MGRGFGVHHPPARTGSVEMQEAVALVLHGLTETMHIALGPSAFYCKILGFTYT